MVGLGRTLIPQSVLGLPPRVERLENQIKQNFDAHDNFTNINGIQNRRMFDNRVDINSLGSRVSSLEARRVQPGGGGARLSTSQTRALDWLVSQRDSIALLSDIKDADVKARMIELISIPGDRDVQNALSTFLNQSWLFERTTRLNLLNLINSWWDSKDIDGRIKSIINESYILSFTDALYAKKTDIRDFESVVEHLKNTVSSLQSQIKSIRDDVNEQTSKIASIKNQMGCVRNAVRNASNNLKGVGNGIKNGIDDAVFGGSDGIRPSRGSFRSGFDDAVSDKIDSVRANLDSVVTCLNNLINGL